MAGSAGDVPEVRKARGAQEEPNNGVDECVNDGVDYAGERRTDDNTNSHFDGVSAGDKVLEALEDS